MSSRPSRTPRRLRALEQANCDPRVTVRVLHHPALRLVEAELVREDGEEIEHITIAIPDAEILPLPPKEGLAIIFSWINRVAQW